MPGVPITLRADHKYTPNRVTPPREPELGIQSSTIIVTYSGFTPEAQAAFQRAVDIWASLITSTVSIRVEATWTVLSPGVLGSARPTRLYGNFPGAPVTYTWYPVALANALSGTDLYSGVDIIADFNSNFSNWYLGTDGNPPGNQYDLTTVALHELGHGLSFYGSMTVSGGQGSWGYASFPLAYDRFPKDGAGVNLIDTGIYPSPSAALASPLLGSGPTPGGVFFAGGNATAANGGTPPKLYTPPTWESGSSYAHLDDNTYDNTANALMTHALGLGESAHNPGPIALGMFQDMGWKTASIPPPPPNPESGSFKVLLPIIINSSN